MCLGAVVALASSSAVLAQVGRALPADLAVTTLKANGGSVVMLGDQKYHLSPAAQVRGQNNLIILPASLYGTHRVGVKRDIQGMVSRIWLLTDDEYKALTSK